MMKDKFEATEAKPAPVRDLLQEQRDALFDMSRRMAELAKSLSSTGKSLDRDQKELLRFAIAPRIRWCFDDILLEFLAGKNCDGTLDAVADLLALGK